MHDIEEPLVDDCSFFALIAWSTLLPCSHTGPVVQVAEVHARGQLLRGVLADRLAVDAHGVVAVLSSPFTVRPYQFRSFSSFEYGSIGSQSFCTGIGSASSVR